MGGVGSAAPASFVTTTPRVQVLSKGHHASVDFWALGILIYELLTFETPFEDESQQRTFEKIVHSSSHLAFPLGMDASAQQLIRALLNPNANMRLGSLRGGFDDIRGHAWFREASFDWKMLERRGLAAPYVPNVTSDDDVAAFDDIDEESDADVPPYKGDVRLFEGF